MKKNATSVTATSAWLTELTDVEMESTTGGLLTNNQLTSWWNAYKDGNLNSLSVLNTLQKELSSGDAGADLKIFQKWLIKLPLSDKKLVIRTVGDFVKDYLKA